MESQSHLEECVANGHLREGKNMEYSFFDKIKNFMELSVKRERRKGNYRVLVPMKGLC